MKTKPIAAPKNWPELTYHPLSQLVDFGAGIDLNGLAQHIMDHGYDEQEAIVLFQGDEGLQVLDGRHRLEACKIAKVVPKFRLFVGENAAAYVAKKILRQHLNESQRARLAGIMAKLPHGGDRRSEDFKVSKDTLKIDEVAKALNVSPESVKRARTVIDHGTPALNGAVKDGTIKVTDAAKVTSEPPEVQDESVEAVRQGHAPTVAAAAQLCDRCRRVGPTNNCTACAELRKPTMTRPVPASKKRESKPPKVGRVLFDWRSFHIQYGALLRQVDTLGNAYRAKDTPPADALRGKLESWRGEFKAWFKAVSKSEPPGE